MQHISVMLSQYENYVMRILRETNAGKGADENDIAKKRFNFNLYNYLMSNCCHGFTENRLAEPCIRGLYLVAGLWQLMLLALYSCQRIN